MSTSTTFTKLLLLGLLAGLLTACKSSSDEESDEDVSVGRPAKEILAAEGSLHTFTLQTFTINTLAKDDVMVLRMDNFAPSQTDIEPKDDEDQTLNDLKYSRDNWNETGINWVTNSNPLLESPYNKTRPYLLLRGTALVQSPEGQMNKPTYETVKDNIFERQLGVSFVWDFGRYGDVRPEREVAGERLDKYQALYGYTILPEVITWADIHGQPRPVFSEGAKIYAASRSVANDAVVVESVLQDSSYSLTATELGAGISDLATLVSVYPVGGVRIGYQFTLDYTHNYTLYISFNAIDSKAEFYDSASGGTLLAEAAYTIHTDKPYLEINTAALSSSDRALLQLPSYFNPVIVGPINNKYHFGKRYIKTDEVNRLLLEPMFFFNNKAKDDIKNTFKAWRDYERFDRD